MATPLSRDPERLARFDREARTLATRQHTNVASIYGFETSGSTRFLVIELAEGEDLSARPQRGAMPVEEVVGLALPLSKGLAAGRWMVSTDKGSGPANRPIWRRDGRELFYLREGSLLAVPVSTETGFTFGEPKPLFGVSIPSTRAYYAPSADGQKILTNEFPPTGQDKIRARLIQNWAAGLAR